MDPTIPPQTTTSGGDNDGCDGGPKDPTTTTIIKRKRTKRQRPTNILTLSSTSSTAFHPSPSSSSDFPAGSTTTEDEDTANCLILLSRGQNIYTMQTNSIGESSSGYKFNSKRYIQTTSHEGNGIYVYECKTCSRTFSSFQALGGHRASHKKHNEFDKRKSPYNISDEDEEPSQPRKNNYSSSSLSLQLNHTNKFINCKVHECSICGAEFNSGQALGGHMRRHRGNINMNMNITAVSAADTGTNTTLSLVPYIAVASVVTDDHRDYQKSTDDGLCLNLDLNLPAPPEIISDGVSDQDQHRESSFKFSTNQNKKQPTVHLSATPTLVDCHY